jgi:uncharacterized oxidoreductase
MDRADPEPGPGGAGMETSGNTVLITGGSGGIGFELAVQLQALGNTVIITGRDQARLKAAVAKSPGLHAVKSDVADPAAIAALYKKLVAKFPGLNVLVNNAGIMRKINLQKNKYDLAGIGGEIETNLIGPIRMVQQFLPWLKSQKSSAIVNISSGLAFVPLPIAPVYCATKAGLHSYTRSLRAQLKNTGVKVFELAPPLTKTNLLDGFDPRDMEGVKSMPVEELARHAIQGMAKDVLEIRPGQSKQLKFMDRVAPGFIFSMLSKSVDPMLAEGGA